METTRDLILKRLAFLATAEGGGHTCFPLHSLVEWVIAASTQQLNASAVLSEVHALRAAGQIATTTHPCLMAARTDMLECERFIAYALDYSSTFLAAPYVYAASLTGGRPLLDLVHACVGVPPSEAGDAVYFTLQSVFMESKPLVAFMPCMFGANVLIQSVTQVAAWMGLSCVVLWAEQDPVGPHAAQQGVTVPPERTRSIHVDTLQDASLSMFSDLLSLCAHRDRGGAPVLLIVSDAHAIDSRRLMSCLIRLKSDVRILLVGDPLQASRPGVLADVAAAPSISAMWPNMAYIMNSSIDRTRGREDCRGCACGQLLTAFMECRMPAAGFAASASHSMVPCEGYIPQYVQPGSLVVAAGIMDDAVIDRMIAVTPLVATCRRAREAVRTDGPHPGHILLALGSRCLAPEEWLDSLLGALRLARAFDTEVRLVAVGSSLIQIYSHLQGFREGSRASSTFRHSCLRKMLCCD